MESATQAISGGAIDLGIPAAGALDLYPQGIIRPLLKLISNGFPAAIKRKAEGCDEKLRTGPPDHP